MSWQTRCPLHGKQYPEPASKAKFGNKQMILVLDNPSYHHGYDAAVWVPEGNTKGYNIELFAQKQVQEYHR